MADQKHPQTHFLVVTFPFQGHLNPAHHLAKRLAADPNMLVTFSTAFSAHRLMFPDSDDQPVTDNNVTYRPFSDGTESGYESGKIASFNSYMASFNSSGSRHLSDMIEALAFNDQPVSYIIYTMLLPWAADVARAHGIPSALYWIQPAAVFAIYYHYFHGYDILIAEHRHDPSFIVNLPDLPPQKIRDLPSFLTASIDETDVFHSVFIAIRDMFQILDKEEKAATVLVNTSQEMEARELAAVDAYNVLPIGPLLPAGTGASMNLFKIDEKSYMEWLHMKPAKYVVYVSFGSLSMLKKAHLQELLFGLEQCRRPYLWVVRKDQRNELVELEEEVKNGMVVEWCDQVNVLSHPSVGCFVTHCGWNSVLESLTCGVPMVGAPRMSDQKMNARLVEMEWKVGVRAEVDDDEGVVSGEEVKTCVETVMGEGERGVEIRRMAEVWRKRVHEAVSEGGSSDRNLKIFLDRVND